MKNMKKALVGAAAATAMAVSVTPATAQHYKHDNGIGAGEVIAGALIIGGIAAVLASNNKNNDRYYHGGNHRYDDRYGYKNNRYKRIGSRTAVNRCISRAENNATRYGRAKVTQIRDIDRTRYGYKIKGRIEVRDKYRGGSHYRGDRYDRKDRYGKRYGYSKVDTGKFTCYIERGRIADMRYSGLKYR